MHEIRGKCLFERPGYLDLQVAFSLANQKLCCSLAAVDVAKKPLGHDNAAVEVGVAERHEPREEVCDSRFQWRRHGGFRVALDCYRRVGDAALGRHFALALDVDEIADLERRRTLRALHPPMCARHVVDEEERHVVALERHDAGEVRPAGMCGGRDERGKSGNGDFGHAIHSALSPNTPLRASGRG